MYRLTETNKWGDVWFYSLKPLDKLIYNYLCDNCDNAGFVEFASKKFSDEIGCTPIQLEGGIKGLMSRLVAGKDNMFFIKNFLKHQKNLPIVATTNTGKGILRRFEMNKDKFDFTELEKIVNFRLSEYIQGAYKGVITPPVIGIDIGKGLGPDKGASKIPKNFIPPTLDEVKKYFVVNGFNESLAERAFKYYAENEWKDKNDQPIKNWKQKMQGVWFREENRTGGTLQFPNHPLSLGRKAPEKRK